MKKRRHLFGVVFVLLALLVPNSAVASPGAYESGVSAISATLSWLMELVTTPDDGDLGPGWDPWGSPALPEADSRDLSSGIDPDG